MQISSSPTFGVLLKTLSATQLVDINGGLVARARGPGSLLKRITFRVQPTCLLGYLISNILSSSQFNKTRRLVKASVADRARATSKFDGKALRNHASSLISHSNNDTCQSSEQGEDYSDKTPCVLSVEQQILPAALARAVAKFEASEFERRINDEWVDLTIEPNTKIFLTLDHDTGSLSEHNGSVWLVLGLVTNQTILSEGLNHGLIG